MKCGAMRRIGCDCSPKHLVSVMLIITVFYAISKVHRQCPGRMPTLVYNRILLSTAVVTVYCRILTEYLAQYYDRISPCRLRRDTTISGCKRSLFLKHHCTRSPCSSSGIGRIRSKTNSYSLSNGSCTIMNDRIRHGELRS